MNCMSVTPEVSQLERSTLKFFRSKKSELMSVSAETSQSATGPYVAMVEAAFALNASTAVFRESLLVNVPGGNGGGEGGEGGSWSWSCTTNDAVPFLPVAKENLCPKPGATHSFPNQPSKRELVISRVHVAPSATANGTVEVYCAPPLSVMSSEQLRLQPTSLG